VKRPELTRPADERTRTRDAPRGSSSLESVEQKDESTGSLDESRVLGLLEENQQGPVDPGDTATMRRVTRMPEGIEVVEHRTGVAEGQWLLQVRCQCGRRWFEIEAVPAATCPRCGLLVFVKVAVPGPPA
jgi:DNA-directed RNA polymerase subunit RPC12/RpoP